MGLLEFNFGFLNGYYNNHSHDCYEFHYILKGEGSFVQNGKSTSFVKDQFLVSTPGVLHCLEVEKQLSFFYIRYYPDKDSEVTLNKLNMCYNLTSDSRVLLSKLRTLLSTDDESIHAAEHLFLYFIYTLLSSSKVPTSYNQEPIINAQNYLMENITKKLSLTQIADHVHLEKHYFCRLFKKSTNLPPLVYFEKLKMEAACSMIKQGNRNYQVAENLGYCDETYFCSRFKKIVGVSPGAFRKLK
ncbi:MAG: AraC family transcriptional regulator [Spirochaetaceae bacterium]